MALVKGKCPNCGIMLKVDNSKKAGVCPDCEEAYIVQEAIDLCAFDEESSRNDAEKPFRESKVLFDIRGGGLLVSCDCGNNPDVIIPDSVTEIGEEAFHKCTEVLRSVSIPSSVEIIREEAFFECCKLEKIYLSHGLKEIGENAFSYCRFKSIDIPASVTELGKYAFESCYELTSIKIPGSITEIPSHCFQECRSLREVVLENGVQRISPDAFSDCKKLEYVYFPDSISLGDAQNLLSFNTARKCNIKTASVPSRGNVFVPLMLDYIDTDIIFRADEERKRNNRCLYCGGTFKGLFNKVCAKCGMGKDYN